MAQFSSVQFNCVQLFAALWIAALQAFLSITNPWSSLRLTSIESVMPSSHLILCHPLFLLPPIWCPALYNPIECSLQDSSVHVVLQARMLEWVAIPFSGGSSQPRGWTQVSCIAGRFFAIWATREAPNSNLTQVNVNVLFFFLPKRKKKREQETKRDLKSLDLGYVNDRKDLWNPAYKHSFVVATWPTPQLFKSSLTSWNTIVFSK